MSIRNDRQHPGSASPASAPEHAQAATQKPPRKSRDRPSPKAREEAMSRIHGQVARRRDADARARRERERLERLVAESVSSQPCSVTWYDHPGLLRREEVLAFGVPRSAAGLHALMERHRARAARR